MLIAFEGPDNTGKSHSAAELTSFDAPTYNATKESHASLSQAVFSEKGIVGTFDRIDWLTHMAYRLALPDHEWNDARVRTVFAMPDTHLVFKLHHALSVPASDAEEGYGDGVPLSVNDMYTHLSYMIMQLNEVRNYSLFKTVTIMEVSNNTDPDHEGFYQRIKEFSSPLYPWGSIETRLVKDNATLLELLLHEEARR